MAGTASAWIRRAAVGSATTAAAAIVLLAAGPAAAADRAGTDGGPPSGHNPPGNNGTVFVHDRTGDLTPHEDPHVGCTFAIDLFGFDQGQTLQLSLAGQAPTGRGQSVTLPPDEATATSPDDAGGAAHDFDAEVAVDASALDLSVLGPPAAQGYHVMLTVTTGQPGPNGVKHKVFWIDCPGAAVAPGTSTGTGGGDHNTTGTPTTHRTRTSARVLGSARHRDSRPARVRVLGVSARRGMTAPTEVLGESLSRAGSLPFTGARTAGLLASGVGALAGGAALALAGRRRRRRA